MVVLLVVEGPLLGLIPIFYRKTYKESTRNTKKTTLNGEVKGGFWEVLLEGLEGRQVEVETNREAVLGKLPRHRFRADNIIL